MTQAATLALLLFAAAALYTAVGHGGASGYLAAMAVVGLAPAAMKPTALVLNILVASIATARYARAGAFAWAILWPFLLGSVPLATLGGAVHLPGAVYRPVMAALLLAAAGRLLWPRAAAHPAEAVARVPVGPAVAAGAGIGLLSGLTGTGGGIFLSPLLLLRGWAPARQTAGVSAAFILVNSIAGLAGNLASVRALPAALPLWAVTAGVALQRLLALVLVIAALKLLLA